MEDTIEQRVLACLDPYEGTQSFDIGVGASLKQRRAALQRLRKAGQAEVARCGDGVWVWFRTREGDEL
jgi:hypothetical protein